MRSLRECLTSDSSVQGSHQGQATVALLSSAVRPSPTFDPHHTFDLDLFGMDVAQASTLGPIVAPLCELVYEALELSGIPMARLGAYRIGTFAAAPDPQAPLRWRGHEPDTIHQLFGFRGPVLLQGGSARQLASLHVACTALQAHEIDLALFLGAIDHGGPEGAIALLLGRAAQATAEGWQLEHRITSALGERSTLRSLAAQRARCEPHELKPAPAPGLQGLVALLGRDRDGPGLVEHPAGACLILSPPEPHPAPPDPPPQILGLSARSTAALRSLVRATAEVLGSEADLAAVASDAVARPLWEHRVALPTVGGVRDVRRRLSGWLEEEPPPPHHGRARLALIAPAQIEQVEHADFLYGTEAVFRDALVRCDLALTQETGTSLLSAMFPPAGLPTPTDPALEAPLAVAIAWSLAQLLASKGATVHAILGLGAGALAAAAIVGRLSIEDALEASVRGTQPQLSASRGGPLWISCVTAEPVGDTLPGWGAASGALSHAALEALSCDTFVELSMAPSPTVATEAMPQAVRLRPVGPDDTHFAELLATLWARGIPIVAGAPHRPRGCARLPTYPWDRDVLRPPEPGPRPLQPTAAPTPVVRAPTLIAPLTPEEEERPPTLIAPLPTPEIEPRQPTLIAPLSTPETELIEPSGRLRGRSHGRGRRESNPALLAPRSAPRSPHQAQPEPHRRGVGGRPNLPHMNKPTSSSDVAVPPTIEIEELGLPTPSGVAIPTAWAEEQTDTLATHVELWHPHPLPDQLPELPPGTWVILADRNGMGDFVSRVLEQRGQQVSKVRHLPGAHSRGHALVIGDPTSTSSWRRVGDLLARGRGPRRVLHLWSLEHGFEATAWAGLLALAEHLRRREIDARIQLVTQGVAARPWATEVQRGAALWGAGRLLAAELPQLSGGMIDLDPQDENPAQLLRQLLQQPDGGEVALRGSQRLQRTLQQCSALPPPRSPPLAGAWILAGRLDLPLARLASVLVASGIHRLLLASPDLPTPEATAQLRALRARGITPVILQADLTQAGGRERLRAHLRTDRIAGVVLRAGVCPPSSGAGLAEIQRPGAVAGFAGELALAAELERLAGSAPLWIWSEGRALDPRPGTGTSAITGASLGALASARIAAGHPTTMIHADCAEALREGQASRLVGRLGPTGGVYGVWAPPAGPNGVPGA